MIEKGAVKSRAHRFVMIKINDYEGTLTRCASLHTKFEVTVKQYT